MEHPVWSGVLRVSLRGKLPQISASDKQAESDHGERAENFPDRENIMFGGWHVDQAG